MNSPIMSSVLHTDWLCEWCQMCEKLKYFWDFQDFFLTCLQSVDCLVSCRQACFFSLIFTVFGASQKKNCPLGRHSCWSFSFFLWGNNFLSFLVLFSLLRVYVCYAYLHSFLVSSWRFPSPHKKREPETFRAVSSHYAEIALINTNHKTWNKVHTWFPLLIFSKRFIFTLNVFSPRITIQDVSRIE